VSATISSEVPPLSARGSELNPHSAVHLVGSTPKIGEGDGVVDSIRVRHCLEIGASGPSEHPVLASGQRSDGAWVLVASLCWICRAD
jgi:hypothetical protein